jgi:hypothetical protein
MVTYFHQYSPNKARLWGFIIFLTFANASSLEYLNLSGNRFCGNLPPSIFSKQSKIMEFDVSANQLI